MKPLLRWSLLLPAVSLAVLASWLLYPLGRTLALFACPSTLRTTESTTDFSQPNFTVSSNTCSANWFPTADGTLIVGSILLSVFAAGVIGYRVSPSHKLLSAFSSSLLAIGAIAVAFAYGA